MITDYEIKQEVERHIAALIYNVLDGQPLETFVGTYLPEDAVKVRGIYKDKGLDTECERVSDVSPELDPGEYSIWVNDGRETMLKLERWVDQRVQDMADARS